MAKPQLEDGFTRIANEILDVVMKTKFNGTQYKIVMAIWRYTYGFNRKKHEFSLNFLAEATQTHKQQIKKELDRLIEMNVLTVYKEAGFNTSREIGFNKYYNKWSTENIQSIDKHTVSKLTDTTVSENAYPTVSKLTDSTVSKFAYQERQYKDNIKKDINTSSSTKEENILSSDEEVIATKELDFNSEFAELAHLYQICIGQPNAFTAQWIDDILKEYGLEWCKNAMLEAERNGKRTKKYVNGILINWSRDGGMKLSTDKQGGGFNAKHIRNNKEPKPRCGPSEETLRLERIAKEKGLIGPNGEVEVGEFDF